MQIAQRAVRDAVAVAAAQIQETLVHETLGDQAVSVRPDGWLELAVDPSQLLTVARALRDLLGFTYLLSLTAVDWQQKGLTVVYHLQNLERGLFLVMTATLPPNQPTVPSVTGIWPTASFQEREAWDLLGVRFEGHPDLRRILMKEGWLGHPLRKDYQDQRPPRERLPKAARK